MFLHPISLVLFSISAMGPHASQPTSPAPLAITQTKPAAVPSAADELVDRLVRNAAALDTALPSITAHEVVQSYASHGLFRQSSRAEGMVRVVRIASVAPLTEAHQMTSRNGKPVPSADSESAQPLQPFQPSDGFIGAQQLFFSRATRLCFTFTLAPQPMPSAPLQLRIALSPDYASLPGCPAGLAGLTGIALADPATRQLTHVEWTLPAQGGSHASFISTDYAPASLGDKTVWLPELTISSGPQGKSSVYTAVYYSDYHQYAATVTVLTADSQ